MRLGEFSFVNDCMVTEPRARYSLRYFSIEFSSRKPIESGLPTRVPNWVLAEGLVFDFATLLSFFHSIDDLEILDSGGVGSQVDWSHTVAKIPDVFPHIKQHLRVKSLHVSADYKEPVLTPLLALLDHVLVPQGLEDFCARQIWNIYDVPYFASLLSHGNIKTLNFNLSGALDSPGNHLDRTLSSRISTILHSLVCLTSFSRYDGSAGLVVYWTAGEDLSRNHQNRYSISFCYG